VVSDPARQAEVLDEIRNRLEYLVASYQLAKAVSLDAAGLNRSLARLRRAVGRPKVPGRQESRLDPRLELLITDRARKLAGIDASQIPGAEHERFVQQAAAEVAKNTKPIRGRPGSECLRHHVEGLMALIQETCGKPVLGFRHKDSVYDPQLPDGVSRLVSMVFSKLDPTVTNTQLVNIIRKARRTYAGKRMRFMDFFPLYGAKVDSQTQVPAPQPPYKLKHFEFAVPIYCP